MSELQAPRDVFAEAMKGNEFRRFPNSEVAKSNTVVAERDFLDARGRQLGKRVPRFTPLLDEAPGVGMTRRVDNAIHKCVILGSDGECYCLFKGL